MSNLNTFLFLVVTLRCTSASGEFELQVLKVENSRNERSDGRCCDSASGRTSNGICIKPCVSSVEVCLKEYQSVTRASDDPLDLLCKLGNATSGVLRPGDMAGDAQRPVVHLTLPFDFAWIVSAILICSFKLSFLSNFFQRRILQI